MGRKHFQSGNLLLYLSAPPFLNCYDIFLSPFVVLLWARHLHTHDNPTGSMFNLTIIRFLSINAGCPRDQRLDVGPPALSPYESKIPPSIQRQYEASPPLRGEPRVFALRRCKISRARAVWLQELHYPFDMRAGSHVLGVERGMNSTMLLIRKM